MPSRPVLLLAVLALAACGSSGAENAAGDSAGPEAAYVDAVAADLRRDAAGSGMDESAARCFAESVVDGLGAAELERAGVTPETLAAAEDLASVPVATPENFAGDLHAAVLSCGVEASLERFFVEGLGDEVGAPLSPDAAGCLTGAMDDNALAMTITASMLDAGWDDSSQDQIFTNGLTACPAAVGELLLTGLGAQGLAVTPESTWCVQAFVAADAPGAAALLASGGPGAEEFGLRLVGACPQLAG